MDQPPPLASWIADAASVGGFGLSVWTLILVLSWPKYFKNLGMLPRAREQIKNLSQRIFDHCKDTGDPAKMALHLAVIGELEASITDVLQIAPKSQRNEIKEVVTRIKSYRSSPLRNTDQLVAISGDIYKLMRHMENYEESAKWQR